MQEIKPKRLVSNLNRLRKCQVSILDSKKKLLLKKERSKI